MAHATQHRAGDKRKQVQLSSKVEKALVAYAVAASAAALGVLASSSSAEAKIVYTPANVPISGRPTPIDFNHDGINDFFLFHYFLHTDTGGNTLLACLNPVDNTRTVCISSYGTNIENAFRVVESKGLEWGAALKRGAKIARADRFQSRQAAALGGVGFPTSSHQKPVWGGPWMNGGKGVKNRYIGVKFK